MLLGAIRNLHDLVDVFITATGVLGGAMAYASGGAALAALILDESVTASSRRINRALGVGYAAGLPAAAFAAMVSI